MNVPLESLSATPAALTVELDLASVHAGQRPPPPLSREQAGHVANAAAADLARILGDQVRDCGMVLPAALYDLTELLQPGLPWVEVLLEIYRGSLAGTAFMPQIVGLGGDLPVSALAPQRRPGSGPLLVLPMLLVGGRQSVERIQQRLEEVLLERGRASFDTERMIRRDFGIEPVNLAYATLNDLAALVKIQLGHAGLDPLWQLLEGALFRPDQVETVRLPEQNVFVGHKGEIYTLFRTFDRWAAEFGGDTACYRRWLLKQRLYEAGLAAHGLAIRRLRHPARLQGVGADRLGSLAAQYEIHDDVLREPIEIPPLDGADVILLTEHAAPELGPVAYTVLAQAADGRLLHMGNEYPLTASAVPAVREYWAATAAQLGLTLHLAQPGGLLVGDDGRHLMPQIEFDGPTH